jgi:hypothetical protein
MVNFTKEDDLKAIILTTAKIFKADGLELLSSLVSTSVPSISQTHYDNWNGGIYYYTLYLTINVEVFVKIRSDATQYEAEILETIKQIIADNESDVISAVKILPIVSSNNESEFEVLDTRIEEPKFWRPAYFKLFISHLATFKDRASALKNALEPYGISAFVAHEDIEPTKEWQQEIEHGLFTMDALCAILMKGFSNSNWTDQEVGVAIGRKILVIPIIKDLNPYGFIGKYQGFKAQGKGVLAVASSIFDILSSHPKTSGAIILRLSELFLMSNNATDALKRVKALRLIKSIPKERIEAMKLRIIENDTLKSVKILAEFNALLQLYGTSPVLPFQFEKVVQQAEDDLPF